MWQPSLALPLTYYDDGGDEGYPIDDGRGLHVQTRIVLDGSDQTQAVWTESLVNHELGHHIMDLYSASGDYEPEHEESFDVPESPIIAWSEGWATFWAVSYTHLTPRRFRG
jgi:hypothetical protein